MSKVREKIAHSKEAPVWVRGEAVVVGHAGTGCLCVLSQVAHTVWHMAGVCHMLRCAHKVGPGFKLGRGKDRA